MQRAADALRRSKKVVFSTGAGISAESGIPTFRDKLTGLWSNTILSVSKQRTPSERTRL